MLKETPISTKRKFVRNERLIRRMKADIELYGLQEFFRMILFAVPQKTRKDLYIHHLFRFTYRVLKKLLQDIIPDQFQVTIQDKNYAALKRP